MAEGASRGRFQKSTRTQFRTPALPFKSVSPVPTSGTSRMHSLSCSSSPSHSTYISPLAAGAGRTIREYDKEMEELRKENFNLKLRLYLMEQKFTDTLGCDAAKSIQTDVQLQMEMNIKERMLEKALKNAQQDQAEYKKALEKIAELEQQIVKLTKELENKAKSPTSVQSENESDIYKEAFGSLNSLSEKSLSCPEDAAGKDQRTSGVGAEVQKEISSSCLEIQELQAKIEQLQRANQELEAKSRKKSLAIQGLVQKLRERPDPQSKEMWYAVNNGIGAAKNKDTVGVLASVNSIKAAFCDLISMSSEELFHDTTFDIGEIQKACEAKDKRIKELELAVKEIDQLIEKKSTELNSCQEELAEKQERITGLADAFSVEVSKTSNMCQELNRLRELEKYCQTQHVIFTQQGDSYSAEPSAIKFSEKEKTALQVKLEEKDKEITSLVNQITHLHTYTLEVQNHRSFVTRQFELLHQHLEKLASFMERLIQDKSLLNSTDDGYITPEALRQALRHLDETLQLSQSLSQNFSTCEHSQNNNFSALTTSAAEHESSRYPVSSFSKSQMQDARFSMGDNEMFPEGSLSKHKSWEHEHNHLSTRIDKGLSLVRMQQDRLNKLVEQFEHVASRLSDHVPVKEREEVPSAELSSEISALTKALANAVSELGSIKDAAKSGLSVSRDETAVQEFKEIMEKVLSAVKNDKCEKHTKASQAKDIEKALSELGAIKKQLMAVIPALLEKESSMENTILPPSDVSVMMSKLNKLLSETQPELSDFITTEFKQNDGSAVCHECGADVFSLHQRILQLMSERDQCSQQLFKQADENLHMKACIERLESKNSCLGCENGNLKVNLESAEKLCNDLRKNLRAAKQKLQELEVKCAQYEAKFEEMLEQKTFERMEMEDKFNKGLENHCNILVEVKALEAQLTEVKELNRNLRNENDQCHKNLCTSEDLCADLKAELRKTLKQLRDMESRFEQYKKDTGRPQKNDEVLSKMMHSLSLNENASSSQVLDGEKAQNQKAGTKNETHVKESGVAVIEAQLLGAHKEIRQLQKMTEHLKVQQSELIQQLSDTNNEKLDLNRQVREKSTFIEKQQSILGETSKKLSSLKLIYDEQCSLIEKFNIDSREKNEHIAKLTSKIEHNKESIANSEQFIEKKNASINQLEYDLEDSRKQLEKFKVDLNEKNKLVSKLSSKIKQNAEVVSNFQQIIKEKTDSIKQLELELKDKYNYIQDVEHKLESETSLKTELQSALKEKDSVISELNSDINEKMEKLVRLEEDIEKQSDVAKNVEADLKEKCLLLDRLQIDLKQQSEKMLHVEKDLKFEHALNSKLQEELEDKTTRCELLKLELQENRDVLNLVKLNLEKESNTNCKLKTAVEEKNKAIEQLEARFREIENILAEQRAVDEEWSHENMEMNKLVEVLKAEVNEKGDTIVNLQNVYKENAACISQLRSDNEKQKSVIRSFEVDIEDKNEKINQLECDLRSKAFYISKLETDINKNSEQLQSKLYEKDILIAQLESSSEKRSQAIYKLKQELHMQTDVNEKCNIALQEKSDYINRLQAGLKVELNQREELENFLKEICELFKFSDEVTQKSIIAQQNSDGERNLMRGSRESYQGLMDMLRNWILMVKDELASRKTLSEESEVHIRSLTSQLAAREHSLELIKSEYEELQREVKHLKNKISSMEVDARRNLLAVKDMSMSSVEKTGTATCDDDDEHNTEVRDLNQLKEQNAEFSSRISALERSLQKSRTTQFATKGVSCNLLEENARKSLVHCFTAQENFLALQQKFDQMSLDFKCVCDELSMYKISLAKEENKVLSLKREISSLKVHTGVSADVQPPKRLDPVGGNAVSISINNIPSECSNLEYEIKAVMPGEKEHTPVWNFSPRNTSKDPVSKYNQHVPIGVESSIELSQTDSKIKSLVPEDQLAILKKLNETLTELKECQKQKVILEEQIEKLISDSRHQKENIEAMIQDTSEKAISSDQESTIIDVDTLYSWNKAKWQLQKRILNLQAEIFRDNPSYLQNHFSLVSRIVNMHSQAAFVKPELCSQLSSKDREYNTKQTLLNLQLDVEFLETVKSVLKYFVTKLVKHTMVESKECSAKTATSRVCEPVKQRKTSAKGMSLQDYEGSPGNGKVIQQAHDLTSVCDSRFTEDDVTPEYLRSSNASATPHADVEKSQSIIKGDRTGNAADFAKLNSAEFTKINQLEDENNFHRLALKSIQVQLQTGMPRELEGNMSWSSVMSEVKGLQMKVSDLSQENALLKENLSEAHSFSSAILRKKSHLCGDGSDQESAVSAANILSRSESHGSLESSCGIIYPPLQAKDKLPISTSDGRFFLGTIRTRSEFIPEDSKTAEFPERPDYTSPDLGIESDPNQDAVVAEALGSESSYHYDHGDIGNFHPQMTSTLLAKVSRAGVYEGAQGVGLSAETASLHAVLVLKDFELLKREVQECVIGMKNISSRAADGVKNLNTKSGTPKKSLEYFTLKYILDCCSNLETCLVQAQRLTEKFSIVPFPCHSERWSAIIKANDELKLELMKMTAEMEKKDMKLRDAMERLNETEKKKDKIERRIAKQLVQTKKVLRAAKCTLEGKPENSGCSKPC